jgi:hypothetical protein
MSNTTTYDVTNYFKYINLQMAAEAFLDSPNISNPDVLKSLLEDGNNRNSKFTIADADKFVSDGWTVLEQKANTASGFSGTLFKNTQTGELVISFRSTEFLDDEVRDSKATNDLEVKQIPDETSAGRGDWISGEGGNDANWRQAA